MSGRTAAGSEKVRRALGSWGRRCACWKSIQPYHASGLALDIVSRLGHQDRNRLPRRCFRVLQGPWRASPQSSPYTRQVITVEPALSPSSSPSSPLPSPPCSPPPLLPLLHFTSAVPRWVSEGNSKCAGWAESKDVDECGHDRMRVRVIELRLPLWVGDPSSPRAMTS